MQPSLRPVAEPVPAASLPQRAQESAESSDADSLVRGALGTQGTPLSPQVRNDAELRIGASFGNLRIGSSSAGSLPSNLSLGSPTSSFESEAHRAGATFDTSRDSADETSEASAPRADLGSVRIHSGEEAAAAADSIDANAFTVANHVVLSDEAGSSGESALGETLAHELTHVAQQSSQGPSVQRQPSNRKKQPPKKKKKNPKNLAIVAKMTEMEKAQLRQQFETAAEQGADEHQEKLKAYKLTDADRKKLAGWKASLQAAKAAVAKRPAGRERDVRVNYMDAVLASMGVDFDVRYWMEQGADQDRSLMQRMMDPADKATDQDLDHWVQDTALYRAGWRARVVGQAKYQLYEHFGIGPEDLATEEQTEAEAAADQATATGTGTTTSPPADPNQPAPPKKRTVEDRQKLEDLFSSLPDSTPSTDIGDEEKLLEQLRTMEKEEIAEFKKYLQSTSRPGAEAKPLSQAMSEFKALSPVDKAALEVNLDINKEDPTGKEKRLDGPVLLELKADAEKKGAAKADYKEARANLMRLKASIQDPELIKQFPDLDLDIDWFVNEIAMADGLLAGAADAGPANVNAIVKQLVANLLNQREQAFKDLANDMAWHIGLSLVPGGAIIAAAKALKKLHDTLAMVQKIYNTGEKILRIIKIIKDLPASYERFKTVYAQAMEVYARIEGQLERVDSAEDLEETLEAQMGKLTDQIEEQLEGKLGDVLEMMFIPESTTPEELMKILLDLPRGLDWLQKMWDFYKSPDVNSEHAEGILATYGFRAGQLLYPFVALMATEINDALAQHNKSKGIDSFDRLIPRNMRKGGRDRSRGLFRRRNRKRAKIRPGQLDTHLNNGATDLSKLIDDDEKGKQWAPGWFRYTLRREVKELNKSKKYTDVRVDADVEQKREKGKPKKVVPEKVPLPPFRLKFVRHNKKDKTIRAELHLNPGPKNIDREVLNPKAFKEDGEEYTGTDPKRQAAIRDWLGDAGYQINRDDNGKPHLRLPGGARADKDTPYLHFSKKGTIKEGIEKGDWENFKTRIISTTTDLPEGYVLLGDTTKKDKTEDAKGAIVQRKAGVADKYKLGQLGLNKSHKLVTGAGEKQPVVIWPAVIDECKTDPIAKWAEPVNAMFAGSGFNRQDKNKDNWLKHVTKVDELKRRPSKVSGPLGYTMRARAGGDLLGSRHLPELKNRDDKGHLIARRFGGSDSYNNLIPMKRSLNQTGAWYDLEQDMAECFIGSKKKPRKPNDYASFDLQVLYPHTATRRPNKFVVTWKRREARTPQKSDVKSDPVTETHSATFDNE